MLKIHWHLNVWNRCSVFLQLSLFSLQLSAQGVDGSNYRQLPDFPFAIVSDDYLLNAPEISDSLFDAAAQGIRFKLNRTELQPDDPFLSMYRDRLLPWLREHNMQLRQVYVKGAASPEGPYENNVRLSRERTRRLINVLHTEPADTALDDRIVSGKSVAEDYALLVKMMAQADDPDYGRVNSLWQQCNGDEACCKRKLMALDGGRVWKRLLKTYFPALRQARVVMWFSRRQPVGIEPLPLEVCAPQQKAIVPPSTSDLVQVPAKYERRHLIALRTNLIHDLLYVPQFGWAYGANVQLEYYPLRGHYTLNAGFTFTNHRHWGEYKFFQIRDLQFELRRYFRGGGVFRGPYVGVYAQGTYYGIGFSKTKGWEGEGGGGGVSVGYTMKLNRKGSLRLEVSASFGMFMSRQDPYVYGNPISGTIDGLYYYDYYGNSRDFKKRNHKFSWFGPTNAGLHITYDVIYRKKKPVGYYQQKAASK